MAKLPPEIIADDILTRIPVKSLVRFRCVSKSWCSLISSRSFIKSHLAKSIETKSHRKLIINNYKLSSTDLDSPGVAVELDHSMKCSNLVTTVMGSCNGLILLCNADMASIPSFMPKDMPDVSDSYKDMYHPDEDSIIWNPSTKKYQHLLYAPTEFPFCYVRPQHIQYGFGYDSVHDDYKVVKMMQFNDIAAPGYFNSIVKVFSLKSKKWKSIDGCPYYLAYDNVHGEFAGGALHWVMRGNCVGELDSFVGAVDLATEKHQAVPLPNFGETKFYMLVGVLGGDLSIFCHYPASLRLDVWVMTDYGVKESWAKIFSFWLPKDITGLSLVRPMAFSKSGREVFLVHDNKKLSWYDLEGKVCKDIDLRGVTGQFSSMVYVESLVRLPHEAKLGEEKIIRKKKTEDQKKGEEKKEEEKQDEKEKKVSKKSASAT